MNPLSSSNPIHRKLDPTRPDLSLIKYSGPTRPAVINQMTPKINYIFKTWTRPDRPLIYVKTMTRPDPIRPNPTRGTTGPMRSYGMILVSPGRTIWCVLSGDGLSKSPAQETFCRSKVSVRLDPFHPGQYVFGLCE